MLGAVLLQLGSRFARESDGGNIGNRERGGSLPALRENLHNAFDEHTGLAAARVGANDEVSTGIQRMPLAFAESGESSGLAHPALVSNSRQRASHVSGGSFR